MSKNNKLVPKWYVLNVRSGYEYKVKNLLKERVDSLKFDDRVLDILVPDEEKIQIRGLKRKIVKKKTFPGYVLVKVMVEPLLVKSGSEYKMDNEVWYVIRNTDGVSGFIGAGTPVPIDDSEVEIIQQRMERYSASPKEDIKFNINDKVEIVTGSFIGSYGKVASIDPEHGKLTVMVDIFNRLTPVQVKFDEIILM